MKRFSSLFCQDASGSPVTEYVQSIAGTDASDLYVFLSIDKDVTKLSLWVNSLELE